MRTNMTANFLALILVATVVAPSTTADPGTYDHYEDAQAPIGLYSKDVGPNAVAFCFINETLPASCHPGPGATPALGGAFFEVDSWNADSAAAASYGRHVRINVEQLSGQVLGGFAALACTDYNDDWECDSGSFGVSDDDCSSGKDEKNCADPTDLGLEFCAEKDDYTYTLIHDDGTIEEGLVDDQYDDFIVYITAWVDIADDDAGGLDLFDNDGDNTGVGASIGHFRVYADWSGQTSFKDQAGCDALNNHLSECSDGSDNDGDGTVDEGTSTSLSGGDTRTSLGTIEDMPTSSEPITLGGILIGIGIGLAANWLYDCLTDDDDDDDKKWCEGDRGFKCYSPTTGEFCNVWIRNGPNGNEICR